MKHLLKKIVLGICILSLIFSSTLLAPSYAVAQGKDVPIGTLFNWHNIQQQSKDYILNGLAWNVAKMALQSLTSSIVNWINNGFDGSPAFLDDPEGFFLDLGDQITGSFIDNVGPLQALCSPWNIDLRLSIGLGFTQSRSDRYKCTLKSVIGNARNASINGHSIEGFTSGDFSQGGWPAFISMTSEPQNNPYGSYLQAKSDVQGQIFGKETKVNNDLNRGQGFLSWEKCSPVKDEVGVGGSNLGLDQKEISQLNEKGKVTTQNGGKYTTSKDEKTGLTTYNKCSTQTPGSVIGAGLNKSLGSSVDQLNLADSINEITSALFAQLISQVLTKGLGGVSQRSSGGSTASYVDTLNSQATGPAAYSNDARNIRDGYAPYTAEAEKIFEIYSDILKSLESARSSLALAQVCFQEITSDPARLQEHSEARIQLEDIQSIILTKIAVSEAAYKIKHDEAKNIVDDIKSSVIKTQTIFNQKTAQEEADRLQEFLSNNAPLLQEKNINAQNDLKAIQPIVAEYNKKAETFMSNCRTLKNRPASRTGNTR